MTETTNARRGELIHLDPADLLIDTNIRAEVALDKDFMASIRDYGVLTPVLAGREGAEAHPSNRHHHPPDTSTASQTSACRHQ